MTNFENIIKRGLHRILCDVNENISHFDGNRCIIDCMQGKEAETSHCYNHECDICIEEWLNEESTIPIYERSD